MFYFTCNESRLYETFWNKSQENIYFFTIFIFFYIPVGLYLTIWHFSELSHNNRNIVLCNLIFRVSQLQLYRCNFKWYNWDCISCNCNFPIIVTLFLIFEFFSCNSHNCYVIFSNFVFIFLLYLDFISCNCHFMLLFQLFLCNGEFVQIYITENDIIFHSDFFCHWEFIYHSSNFKLIY